MRDLVSGTPLHKATANGDTRALRLLIGSGADLDAPNLYGDTCIHRAVENVRLATLTELLRHGARACRARRGGREFVALKRHKGVAKKSRRREWLQARTTTARGEKARRIMKARGNRHKCTLENTRA